MNLEFKAKRPREMFYVICLCVLSIFGMFVSTDLVDSYTWDKILFSLFTVIIIYQLYYMMAVETLKYSIDENGIEIIRFFGLKKTFIPQRDIIGYLYKDTKISGVKLSGYSLANINYGKCFEDTIGLCKLFLTSSHNNFYIVTKDITYVISPADIDKFNEKLDKISITVENFKRFPKQGKLELYKDKQFMIPFLLTSFLCIVSVASPLALYGLNMLPQTMPLKFNSLFQPVLIGTGKQFASTQMFYGVGTMALLMCMYYATHFTAKFDKRSSYKYIYIALLVVVMVLIVQFRILYKYL